MSKIIERLFQQRDDGMYTILVEKGAMRIEIGDDHGGTRKPIDKIDHGKRTYRRGTELRGYKVVGAYYPFPDNFFTDGDPRWTKVEPMPSGPDISDEQRITHFECAKCHRLFWRGHDSYKHAWATGSKVCISCLDPKRAQ